MEQNIPDEVLKEVDAQLEETFKDYPRGMGFCHIYWTYKKKYLADRGYEWESPADQNPDTIYD